MKNEREPLAALELDDHGAEHIRRAMAGGSEYGRRLLEQLNRAELVLCWADAWLSSRPGPVWRLERDAIVSALRQEASTIRRQQGASPTPPGWADLCDCEFLANSLERGSLVIATRQRIDEAREAQAARRRALDLERWQAAAEAAARA